MGVEVVGPNHTELWSEIQMKLGNIILIYLFDHY